MVDRQDGQRDSQTGGWTTRPPLGGQTDRGWKVTGLAGKRWDGHWVQRQWKQGQLPTRASAGVGCLPAMTSAELSTDAISSVGRMSPLKKAQRMGCDQRKRGETGEGQQRRKEETEGRTNRKFRMTYGWSNRTAWWVG